MALLAEVRALGLSSWCIGAGAVRNLVWDRLHGVDATSSDDIDVVYFDAAGGPERDAELAALLRSRRPGVQWDVTNQATVHGWFLAQLGRHVAPLRSLEEGVATWPEYATCVGVTLNDDDSMGIVAPHGLDDLFALRVRHNPARADAATFQQRVAAKRFRERWPQLQILSTGVT
ncbi:nucleotidyltransferase family protein [Oxalobacteraceae bacterium A2-2]